MKKVLLASSILALTAGAASAEIVTSGSARMGLVYDSAANRGDGRTYFSSRVRVAFTMSGETDGGLSFGASVRHDQDDTTSGNGSGDTNGENTVFISGAFGKLTMGDVSGAADALVGQTSGVGFGPNDGLHEIGFIGQDKTGAYYEYSNGALTFGLGVGQTKSYRTNAQKNAASQEMSVAVKYSAGGYSAAIGYETSDPTVGATTSLLSMSGSATFGAATVKAKIADSNVAGADTAWSLSVDYVAGPTTVTAFYTDFGNTIAGAGADTKHIGLGAAYDLGGGATLAGGIVRQDRAVGGDTFADVGLKFSF